MARLSIMLVAVALATIASLDSCWATASPTNNSADHNVAARDSLNDDSGLASTSESAMRAEHYSPLLNGLVEWLAKFKALSIGDLFWSMSEPMATVTADAPLANTALLPTLQRFAVRLQI